VDTVLTISQGLLCQRASDAGRPHIIGGWRPGPARFSSYRETQGGWGVSVSTVRVGVTLPASEEVAQKCAADAANYVHPKLANISHANDPDHSLIISDEERANAVLALLAKGGVDLH
jgi:hypothetical protein